MTFDHTNRKFHNTDRLLQAVSRKGYAHAQRVIVAKKPRCQDLSKSVNRAYRAFFTLGAIFQGKCI